MERTLKLNSLIVLLILIGTSCIARNLKNQFIWKSSTSNLFCDTVEGTINICPNHISASLTVDMGGEVICDYVSFDAYMNISNIAEDCHFHHYGGNINMTITPNNVYNHKITDNVTPNGVFNDNITISIDLCRNRFIFNLTSCDDCDEFVLKGFYQVTDGNNTCSQFTIIAFAPQY